MKKINLELTFRLMYLEEMHITFERGSLPIMDIFHTNLHLNHNSYTRENLTLLRKNKARISKWIFIPMMIFSNFKRILQNTSKMVCGRASYGIFTKTDPAHSLSKHIGRGSYSRLIWFFLISRNRQIWKEVDLGL